MESSRNGGELILQNRYWNLHDGISEKDEIVWKYIQDKKSERAKKNWVVKV
jgi:hypothetical protein